MKTRNIPTLEAVALAAILAIAGLSLIAAPMLATPTAPEEVIFTGWLHVDDNSVDDLVLVVTVDEDRCLYAEVEGSGRFVISVPVGCRAMLSFFKPGHLTKEVEIDTRNSMNTSKAQRANKKVKFDVVMEAVEKRPGRKYEGPVGSLSFVRGTGTMKVKHDLRVVAE
ncbi:MAG: hypothetical protein IPL52_09580 [Flavobacteriales bacterium]|nr:hypothetical protein [Flavobacteriales bacterium]